MSDHSGLKVDTDSIYITKEKLNKNEEDAKRREGEKIILALQNALKPQGQF